jgi:simple sugar transport system substrate-binding protein
MSEELTSQLTGGMERSSFLKRTLVATTAVSFGGLLTEREIAAAADTVLGPRKDIRIEYPQTGGLRHPFFAVIFNGARQAGKDLGIKVNIRGTATFDGSVDQARLVKAATVTKPTGIVTGVWDPDAMAEPIKNAVKAGIQVVMINQGLKQWQEFGALGYVGQDEYLAGLEAGKRMRAAGVKKAFILNHNLGEQALRDRANGFIAGFKGTTKVVATDVNDATVSVNRVKAAIQKTDFDGLFGLGSTFGGEAALKAVADLGKTKQFKIATFDFTPVLLAALQKKQVLFCIDQQQYLQGYLPMMWITLNNQYGLKPYQPEVTGPNIVLPENASSVVALSKAGFR